MTKKKYCFSHPVYSLNIFSMLHWLLFRSAPCYCKLFQTICFSKGYVSKLQFFPLKIILPSPNLKVICIPSPWTYFIDRLQVECRHNTKLKTSKPNSRKETKGIQTQYCNRFPSVERNRHIRGNFLLFSVFLFPDISERPHKIYTRSAQLNKHQDWSHIKSFFKCFSGSYFIGDSFSGCVSPSTAVGNSEPFSITHMFIQDRLFLNRRERFRLLMSQNNDCSFPKLEEQSFGENYWLIISWSNNLSHE